MHYIAVLPVLYPVNDRHADKLKKWEIQKGKKTYTLFNLNVYK